ncbi:MAG: HAD family phosphatase [Subdoligranulum sp.]|nr:HAD family phosphatase [Subdoligranulum sp.]
MSTLFVTDLDGTLLDANARLSAQSVELLRPLLREGLQLAAATARSPATVVQLLRPLSLSAPAVLMTGTMLYDLAASRCLATTPISRHAVDALCEFLEYTGQEALAYCVRDGQLTVYYKEIACEFERTFISRRTGTLYKSFVQTDSYPRALSGCDVLLFMFALPDRQQAEALQAALSDVPEIYCHYYADEYGSGGYILELFPEGCTKASALTRIMELTGTQRIVSFGDNINDIPMFRMSAHSCAVANAVPQARGAASEVIGANTQDGVARWLTAHWREWQ